MKIVKNFTQPDFQAKTFTPSISPNFNSFSDETQKMSENGENFSDGRDKSHLCGNFGKIAMEGYIKPVRNYCMQVFLT